MEILVICLIALGLAFAVSLIKMVLSGMRQGFTLKRDHLYLIIAYIASSLLLGGGLYVAFGLFMLFGGLFGLEYRTYLLYCFGSPQIILLPIFTFLFFKNGKTTQQAGANLDKTPQASADETS